MSDPPSEGTRWVAVVVSCIGLAFVVCGLGAVTIAAPKFMRFQDRSMQSECKWQLRAISIAERASYAEFDRYSPKLADVNISVEKGNRYQDRLGPGPIGEEAIGVETTKRGVRAADHGVRAAGVGLRGSPAPALEKTAPRARRGVLPGQLPGRVANFANLAPWCDLLFGTYHCPAKDERFELGLPQPIPLGYLSLLFLTSRHPAALRGEMARSALWS